MTLVPEYGQTPVSDEDKEAFTAFARQVLGANPTKAEVYDIEQAIQDREATEHLIPAVIAGELGLDDLLTDRFARDLHGRLYGELCTWAGVYRVRELSIGVAPYLIAEELHGGLGNVRFRWDAGHWSAQVLGIAAHAEVVRVHPFVDGNGRLTRLLADLVLLAALGEDELKVYDWHADGFLKREYVRLLAEYDKHRDPGPLAEYIGVRQFGE